MAKAGKGKKRRGEDGEEGGEDEEGGSVRKRSSSGRTYGGLFDASVALGMSMRAVQMDGQDKYTGGMYPEFIIRADFYPLVLATRGFLRNLGLGLSYARDLSLSTKDKDGNPVDSSAQEFLINLQLHWVFLDRDTSPEVTILAGFGLRDFNLGDNVILPSFNPKFIRFGFDGAIPFGTQYIGLGVGFDARVLLAAGANAVHYLGNRSGGFGIAARAGLQGLNAANVTGIDPTKGDHPDPSTLVDRYIRLWAGAGYAY